MFLKAVYSADQVIMWSLAIVLALFLIIPRRLHMRRRRSILFFGLPLVAVIVVGQVIYNISTPRTTALASSAWQPNVPVLVKFVAKDHGSRVRFMNYRVDGGVWLRGWNVRVAGDGRHAIEYFGTGWLNNDETLHTRQVLIDANPPQTVDDAKPWARGTATVNLTAFDLESGVASTAYRVDRGVWTNGKVVRVSGEGQHRVEYYSTDAVGNREAPQFASLSIDNGRPVTSAPDVVTVGEGYWTVVAFRVTDATPKAWVTIKVTGPHSHTYEAGLQPTNKMVSFGFVCELPYGTYTYRVDARDLAGNRSSNAGGGRLLKPVPSRLMLTASVDDPYPPQNSTVTVLCHVTNEYGVPVSGARLSSTWYYMTVTRTEPGYLPTDSSGNGSMSRPISRAHVGRFVPIVATARWRGLVAEDSTGFTPQ